LLSTLSSLVLFALVLAASSMSLFLLVALPLLGGGLSLLLTAILLFRHDQLPSNFALTHSQRAFQLKHVLMIALSISSISLASTWIGSLYGEPGTLISAVIVGFAEIHAAAVGISQLASSEGAAPPIAVGGYWVF
jgi:uncharacterized membrane protein (DUF4010 family)